MAAGHLLSGSDEAEKNEELSATIFVVGKVEYKIGHSYLSGRTEFDCRLAVKEFFQRARIVKHRGPGGSVVSKRTGGRVILVATSFDRRGRERYEAVKKIGGRFASFTEIPSEQIVLAMEGEKMQGIETIQKLAAAIQEGKYPQKVIVASDEPLFRFLSPLERILKKYGITPEYLRESRYPLPAYA